MEERREGAQSEERHQPEPKREPTPRTALLMSGGPDSLIAHRYLERNGHLVTWVQVLLGHRYQDVEIRTVDNLLTTINRDRMGESIVPLYRPQIDLGQFEEENANIPMRNLFLAAMAAQFEDEVCLVVQQGERDIPDRSSWFFTRAGRLLEQLKGSKVHLFTPFHRMTKVDMVQWYLLNGGDASMLRATWSCFDPVNGDPSKWKPCGNCAACFRRWVAFSSNGIDEELARPIKDFDGLDGYIERLREGKYDPRRTRQTIQALKQIGVEV